MILKSEKQTYRRVCVDTYIRSYAYIVMHICRLCIYLHTHTLYIHIHIHILYILERERERKASRRSQGGARRGRESGGRGGGEVV